MRIDRIDLTRYGPFTGVSHSLPSSAHDFHIIFGPNEAGKSSLRMAISELLFGIGQQTPMNFLHPYPELLLGARITGDGRTLDVRRVKKRKGSLTDPAGNALDERVLSELLGGADQAYFESMFSLDHSRLVEGGGEILKSDSDLGRVLFQAASGIEHLQSVRKELATEADRYFGGRGAGRAYSEAEQRMREAAARLKEVAVNSTKWSAARRRLQEAEQALDAAKAAHLQAGARLAQLRRIKQVAPILARYAETSARLDALGAVTLLPETARHTVEQAQRMLAATGSKIQLLDTECAQLEAQVAAIAIDQSLLDEGAAIEALAQQTVRYRDSQRDLPGCERQLAAINGEILQIAQELGWSVTEAADVRDMLPPQPIRRSLHTIADESEARHSDAKLATEDTAAVSAELEEARNSLRSLPQIAEGVELEAAAHAANALGAAQRYRDLEQAILSAKRRLDACMGMLAPWQGEAGALRGLQVPADAEIEDWLRTRERLRARQQDLNERLSSTRQARTVKLAEIERFEARHQPVSAEQLGMARGERDQLWLEIRGGKVSLHDAATRYEDLVSQADLLADRRHDHHDDVLRAEGLRDDAANLETQLTAIEAQDADLAAALKGTEDRASAACRALGLPDLGLERLQAWLQGRTKALQALDALEDEQLHKRVLDEHVDAATRRLRFALDASGFEERHAALAPWQRLDALIAAAGDIHNQRVRLQTQRGEINKRIADLERKLKSAEQRKRDAEQALRQWAGHWKKALSDAKLDPGQSTPAGRAALELMKKLDDLLERGRVLMEDRILPMRSAIESFQAEAGRLVNKAAQDLTGIDDPADQAQELYKRLRDIREASRAALDLRSRLAARRNELAVAEEERRSGHAALSSLMELCGAADLAGLSAAVDASEARRRLESELEKDIAEATRVGEGLGLHELQAEVAGASLTELEAQLQQASDDHGRTLTALQELASACALAQSEMNKIAGDAQAAEAEAARVSAIAQMGAAANEYLRLKAGELLLNWALERYREKHQGPLVAKANAYFTRLTSGQHQQLMVTQDEPPQLMSRHHSGRWIGVSAMSDGTRDQLYLALRLAAIEMHIDSGRTALPFIGDDLLINYDDDRTGASLEALHALSEKTQVLYFTHHRRLVEIARERLGANVSVIDLGARIEATAASRTG